MWLSEGHARAKHICCNMHITPIMHIIFTLSTGPHLVLATLSPRARGSLWETYCQQAREFRTCIAQLTSMVLYLCDLTSVSPRKSHLPQSSGWRPLSMCFATAWVISFQVCPMHLEGCVCVCGLHGSKSDARLTNLLECRATQGGILRNPPATAPQRPPGCKNS